MKKFILAAAIGAATFGIASAASAALVVDFGAEAANGGERGLNSGDTLGPTADIGTPVQLSTWNPDAHPYLDGPDASEPTAGLGVCQTLDANAQCNPSNDDNVQDGEAVQVLFLDGPFNVTDISFLGEGHVDKNGDATHTLLVGANGTGDLLRLTFAQLVDLVHSGVATGITSLEFFYDSAVFASYVVDSYADPNPDQFYIGSITVSKVPLPAAAPFLLMGLAGLGGMMRRRKAKAAR